MTKNSKIMYLMISAIFFIFAGEYFSDYILQNGFNIAENPVFSIVFVQNEGAAFNIFDGYKTFLIVFSACAILTTIIYTIKHIEKISVLGLLFISLMTAGIFNNMYERIAFGSVRDFIKLNFVNFPIFNLSDIFINISVFSLIFLIIKKGYLTKIK